MRIYPVAFIMLTIPAMLFSQVKAPVVDDIPDVGFNAAETSEKYAAGVTLYGKEPLKGEIVLNIDASISTSDDSGKIYSLREISRITVTAWSGKRKGAGWIFYPESYGIILKDGTRLAHNGNLEFLNRIRFTQHGGRSFYIYTCYYDYFRNGKWVNTGGTGEKSAPSRPADGCLYLIELK